MASKWLMTVLGIMALALAGLVAGPSPAEAQSPPVAADGKTARADEVTNEVTQGALRFKNPEGLYVECPLKHTDVQAEIAGFIARVRVTQTFVNSAKDKIEAVYVFPLPHKSAVDSMTMKVGDKTVVGLIKRREVARQIYEQALAAGQTAALLEQERPNIFTQSVGNIQPGQTVRIEITYVDVLDYDTGVYAFHFPMTIGHRYMPGSMTLGRSGTGTAPDTDRVPDASRITPPRLAAGAERSGADISLSVRLDAGVPVQDFKSVNHKADLKQTGKHTASCALAGGDTIPNKDFDLRYKVTGEKPELAVLAHADSGKDGYFMLMVQPRDDDALRQAPPREIVFLVDASGSMNGQPQAKCKQTMKAFLARTKPADKLQVITFQNHETKCFDRPVECTADNVTKATEFINAYSSAGGTEMSKGVTAALNDPADPERVRIVMLLTDGGVGNESEILKQIKDRTGDKIRCWCIGIGTSVNRFFIDNVGKQGGGMSKMLSVKSTDQDVDDLVNEVVMRIHRAQLANIAINWGALNVYETYPARVPELWAGRPVVVFGRYTGGGKTQVRLSGEAEGQAVSFNVAAELPKSESKNDVLAVTWARQKIESLMESVAYADDSPEVIEEVTKIALEYKLMSQYTSFVAVDAESAKDLEGPAVPPRRVAVPIPIPEGVSPSCFSGAPVNWGVAAEELDRAGGVVTNGSVRNAQRALAEPSAAPAPAKPVYMYQPMYKAKEAASKDEALASGGRGRYAPYAGTKYRQAEGKSGGYAADSKKQLAMPGMTAPAAAPAGPAGAGGAMIAPPPAPPMQAAQGLGRPLVLADARKELGELEKRGADRDKADGAAARAGEQTAYALAEETQKRSEADAKKAKALLEAAEKFLKDGQFEAARGAFQLAYLFDEARLGGGEVASLALAKLEEIENKLGEARLAAEPKLKTRINLVLREKELGEALVEVAKAGALKLQIAPGALTDVGRLVGSRATRITYLDLRRYTVAQALDALAGPPHLDWSVARGRISVTVARRGSVEAPWTYDVGALAIPEPKELGDDYQKAMKAAGAAAEEFLAAARKAVGAREDQDCFWFAPGQLVVFGDADVHAKAAKFITGLENGEGPLGRKASERAAARKDLLARAERSADDQETYGVLYGASWRLLAAAAGGESDLESLTWLESAWKSGFAKQLAGTSRPVTALRSAWAVTESALAVPADKELGALAKTALGAVENSADSALAALEKDREDGGAYLATLYAALALRNGHELRLVKESRLTDFTAKAVPLLTARNEKGGLESVRVLARVLFEKDPPEAKTLAKLFGQGVYGDDLTALSALAARKAGGETWLAFRAEAKEKLRTSGASGPVVLLANRLNKPLLPTAK